MTTEKAQRLLYRWEIVIALAALIGALVFNAWQTRMETKAIRLQTAALDAQRKAYEAQTWQMINQQTTETSKVLIENPRIIPYFTRGKHIDPRHRDYDLVMTVAELYLDFIDGFDDDYVRSLAGMGKDGENWRLWQRYFEDAFTQSPAMCIRLAETKDWYSPNTQKYAEKGCGMNAAYQSYLKKSSQTLSAHPTATHGREPTEATKTGER